MDNLPVIFSDDDYRDHYTEKEVELYNRFFKQFTKLQMITDDYVYFELIKPMREILNREIIAVFSNTYIVFDTDMNSITIEISYNSDREYDFDIVEIVCISKATGLSEQLNRVINFIENFVNANSSDANMSIINL